MKGCAWLSGGEIDIGTGYRIVIKDYNLKTPHGSCKIIIACGRDHNGVPAYSNISRCPHYTAQPPPVPIPDDCRGRKPSRAGSLSHLGDIQLQNQPPSPVRPASLENGYDASRCASEH